MDKMSLAKKLLDRKSVKDTSEQSNFSGASVFYMIAVTSSSNGKVVLKNENITTEEWEEGDYIELNDDGDYEEYEIERDPMADVGGPVIDLTDGDGIDIEATSGIETVGFSVSDYHSYAVNAASEESTIDESEEFLDDELLGDETVDEEIDDGDSVEPPDEGDGEYDDLLGDDEYVPDTTDDEFTDINDDESDDESDDIEGVEISDGYTTADCIGSVKQGDRVAVLVQNGVMTVIGTIGSGDEQRANSRDNDIFFENTQVDIEDTKETVSGLTSVLGNTQETLDSINDQLSSLIVDSSGNPMMENVEGLWKFNLGSLLEQLNNATEGIKGTNTNLDTLIATVNSLSDFMKQLEPIMDYFHIGVDENDKPNLIIGRKDGLYGVRITDEKVDFIEGSAVPAYISNQALNIDRAIIDKELYVGGFVIRERTNGNLRFGVGGAM